MSRPLPLVIFAAVVILSSSAFIDVASAWPTASRRINLNRKTIEVEEGQTFDGAMAEYYGVGDGGQVESQPPAFKLHAGATLKNMIIGSPAGDGVHCLGDCTITNVWWTDVGEDAASFKGKDPNTRCLVDGGGARSATDKVFQFNGGGTLTVQNFEVYGFGKVVRSCGTCSDIRRNIVMRNILAETSSNSVCIVGINTNNGDTATLSNIKVTGSKQNIPLCEKYQGTKKVGAGVDGKNCIYSGSTSTSYTGSTGTTGTTTGTTRTTGTTTGSTATIATTGSTGSTGTTTGSTATTATTATTGSTGSTGTTTGSTGTTTGSTGSTGTTTGSTGTTTGTSGSTATTGFNNFRGRFNGFNGFSGYK